MHSWSIPLWGRWEFGVMVTTFPFHLGFDLTISPRYEEKVDLWIYLGPIVISIGFDKRMRKLS